MSINLIDNFEVNVAMPIDNRLVVQNKGDIDNSLIYEGLRIYEKSSEKCWLYTTEWVEEFPISEHINGQASYISKFDNSNKISNSIIKQENGVIYIDGDLNLEDNNLKAETIQVGNDDSGDKLYINGNKIKRGGKIYLNTLNELTSLPTWDDVNVFVGMSLFIIDDSDDNNNGMYILIDDADVTDLDNWRFIKFESM